MLLSLSVNIETADLQVKVISISFGLLMLFFIILAYFYFFNNVSDLTEESNLHRIIVIISMGVVILSQTLPVLLYCRCHPLKLLIGFLAYIFMVPTYTNMFTIYSFCNTHDVSWGTRSRSLKNVSGAIAEKIDSYKKFRFHVLWIWIVLNIIGAYVFNQLVRRGGQVSDYTLITFACFLAFTLVFRLIAAVISRCCRLKRWKEKEVLAIKPWQEAELPATPQVQDLMYEYDKVLEGIDHVQNGLVENGHDGNS